MGACSSCCRKSQADKAEEGQRSDCSGMDITQTSEEVEQKPVEIYVAKFKYEPGSSSEVALEKGDRVELLTKEPFDFAFVRQLKMHGIRGYVASEFLALENSGMDEEFYYGEIKRGDVINILMNASHLGGTFVVRGSEAKQQGDENPQQSASIGTFSPFVLSVKDASTTPSQVHHYRVWSNPSNQKLFAKEGKEFGTLRELIAHYQDNEPRGDICCRLKKPLVRPVPTKRELPQEMRERWREIPRTEIELKKMLGAGRFGDVQKGIWKQPDGRQVLIVAKQLGTLSLQDKQSLLNEAGMMKDLCHENIVKLFGVVSASEPYYLVTEFIKNGSVQDYLKQRQHLHLPQLKTSSLVDICAQISRGMAYLSSKRIVHRDSAARNVLIDVKSESPFSCVCKICDFGLARALNKEYVYKMKHDTYIATRWLAPEGYDLVFSTKTDVWAFGVTMCEIFSGGLDPWGTVSESEMKRRVFAGSGPPKPRKMPRHVYDISKRCCQFGRNTRPTFAVLATNFEAALKTSESKSKKSESVSSQSHSQN